MIAPPQSRQTAPDNRFEQSAMTRDCQERQQIQPGNLQTEGQKEGFKGKGGKLAQMKEMGMVTGNLEHLASLLRQGQQEHDFWQEKEDKAGF